MANTEVGYTIWGELQDGPKWFRKGENAFLVFLVSDGTAQIVEIREPQPARLCVAGNKLVMAQDLGPVRGRFALPPTVEGLKARLEAHLAWM